MALKEKVLRIKEEFDLLNSELSDADVINNREIYRKKVKRHAELSPIIEKYKEYLKCKSSLNESEELLKNDPDPEVRNLASSEIAELNNKLAKIDAELRILLAPRDPSDSKNAIMEIRAGTGGDEAGLFAGDLFKMYSRYAEKNGLKTETIDSSPTEIGGLKEIIFEITGDNAYGRLKFESGTHRVQRVPKTEASGRIHTSAVTVAVLPEQEEVDVQIKPDELKIDVFRASGAGGQHVNRTESAVRITHIPTGIEVSCQDGRSQLKNKEKAMTVLRARVKARLEGAEKSKLDENRKLQIGSGDRSEKIRTYNFPQSRITDHRIGYTIHNLEEALDGEIDELIQKLTENFNKKLMETG